MSYNPIDFNKFGNLPEDAEQRLECESLINEICGLIQENDKMMHLDLSGCNLGPRIEEIGQALSLSVSLQAVHLSFNGITDEQKETLFNQLRVNSKARKNKAQTSLAEHSEKTWDEVNTRAKNNITLKENKKQKRDYKDL